MTLKRPILTLVSLVAFLLQSNFCGAQTELDVLKDSGYDQLHRHQYKAAIETYSHCLKLKPDPDFYHSRALAYLGLAMNDSAMIDLQSALKIDSNHYKSILGKANLLQSQQKWKEASTLIDKAIKLKPGETEPYLTRAKLQLSLKDTLGALKSLDLYIKHNTSNPEAYDLRGLISLKLNQEADAAFNFNRAIYLNPRYLPSLLQRAELFYRRNYLAITFADLETALKIDSNLSQIHELYVKVYFKLGEYELAKKHIPKVNKETLETLDMKLIMAELALIDRRYDQCIKLVNQIIGQYPLINKAYLLRAKAYLSNGNAANCFKDCNKIIQSGDSTLTEVFKLRAMSRPKEKDHSDWKKNLADITIYLNTINIDPDAWKMKAHFKYLLNENGFCDDYQKAKALGLKTNDNELETACK